MLRRKHLSAGMTSLVIAAAMVSSIQASPNEANRDDDRGKKEEKEERAQQSPPPSGNTLFFRVAYSPAWAIPTNDFVKGENRAMEPIGWAQGGRVELGWQTDGSEDWHQLYNFPAYGGGFYTAGFGNKEELGNPYSIYGFFSWPMFRPSEKVSVTTEFAFGFVGGFKEFDPVTNPFNRAIGGNGVYIDWGFYLHYLLTEKLDLYAGATFTHFSNGHTKDPNLGLNTYGPLVSLRYNFHDERPSLVRRETGPYPGNWELALSGAGGFKNVTVPTETPSLEDTDRRKDFATANVNATFYRQFYSKGKIATGLDVTYDGSANARIDEVNGEVVESIGDSTDKMALGWFGGYEHVIHRFNLFVHVGYYVWRGRDDDELPSLYQRIGLKYHITENFFAGMNIRFIDFGKADWIEWTAGYRLRWF